MPPPRLVWRLTSGQTLVEISFNPATHRPNSRRRLAGKPGLNRVSRFNPKIVGTQACKLECAGPLPKEPGFPELGEPGFIQVNPDHRNRVQPGFLGFNPDRQNGVRTTM